MNVFGFEHLLVYGGRLAGRRVRDYLQAREQAVDAFLDCDVSLTEIDSLPVMRAERWVEKHDPATACVVIGVFNAYVNVAEIFDDLEALGFGRIVSLVEFVRLFPDGQPFRYWLVDPAFLERHMDRIAAFRAALADAPSRHLLDRLVEFRTHGDPRCLPPVTEQQYFPPDLPRWPSELRFIDCGGYTGDTVQALHEAGYTFSALATFEPNLEHYQTLTRCLSSFPGASHFPCGVSNQNRLSGFDPSLGAGGHLVEHGGDPVFCVRLDDALPGFAPTLLKMDIEGEEPAALRGAERMLRESRPNLAVSIYHRAEHLWEIAEQIQSYGLGYRFYLRCHAHSSFDTVLYAVPAERS